MHTSVKAALAAAVLALACDGATTGTTNYLVAYRLVADSSITFDSVRYENSRGTIVTVTAPRRDWTIGFPAITGTYVQASAWGRTLADSQTASLILTLTAAGSSNDADSSTDTSAVPGSFTLSIPRMQLH